MVCFFSGESQSRGRCGGPPCPERHRCQSGVFRPTESMSPGRLPVVAFSGKVEQPSDGAGACGRYGCSRGSRHAPTLHEPKGCARGRHREGTAVIRHVLGAPCSVWRLGRLRAPSTSPSHLARDVEEMPAGPARAGMGGRGRRAGLAPSGREGADGVERIDGGWRTKAEGGKVGGRRKLAWVGGGWFGGAGAGARLGVLPSLSST